MKQSNFYRLTIFLILLLLSFQSHYVFAETTVGGNITVDTAWTKANSPYIVTSTIQVYPGAILTIKPGVTIKFESACSLVIGGTLIAVGVVDDIIIFTSNKSSPQIGDWGSIKFIDSAQDAIFNASAYANGSVIQYSKIEYGVHPIDCRNASPFIANNEIVSCDGAGIYAYYADNIRISNNLISTISTGIYAQNSSVIIENNTITGPEYGIRATSDSSGIIKNNKINNTKNSGISIEESHKFDILNNIMDKNADKGIHLKSCADEILVQGNTVNNNKRGIYSEARCSVKILNNTLQGNTDGAIFAPPPIHYSAIPFIIQDNNISNNPGIAITNGTTIRNNQISSNGSAIIGDIGDVLYNVITNNTGRAINSSYGGGTGNYIRYNLISNNTGGVYINGNHAINNNNIYVEDFVYTVSPPSILDASNNYWGTTDASLIDIIIKDYYDFMERGKVNYKPIATQPFDFSGGGNWGLTVTKAGNSTGTVTSTPAGIDCGSICSTSFTSGTSVTLSSQPSAGSSFTGWSGDCSGTSTTCTITMDAAKSVTATFNIAAVHQYSLTITKSGTGAGTVTSSPSGINCGSTCSASYNADTQVTLTAAAAPGSTFTGWSGVCSGTTCTLTMDAAKSVTATFNVSDVTATSVSLSQGWNFVSFTKQPPETAIEKVLKDVSANIRIVWGYDNVTKQWKKYKPAVTGNELSTVASGKGYWIYMNAAGAISMTGWGTPNTSIHLDEGWNLIGYSGIDNQDLLSALNSISGKWDIIWGWEAGQWYAKHATLTDLSVLPLSSFNQSKAYWIKIKPGQATDWNQ